MRNARFTLGFRSAQSLSLRASACVFVFLSVCTLIHSQSTRRISAVYLMRCSHVSLAFYLVSPTGLGVYLRRERWRNADNRAERSRAGASSSSLVSPNAITTILLYHIAHSHPFEFEVVCALIMSPFRRSPVNTRSGPGNTVSRAFSCNGQYTPMRQKKSRKHS